MLVKQYDGDVKFTTDETTSASLPRMLYVPKSVQNTLTNMKSGLRDNELNLNRPNQINVTTNHNYHQRLRHFNQLVLNYNEEDRFLYLYGTYLWYLFEKPEQHSWTFLGGAWMFTLNMKALMTCIPLKDVEKNIIDSNHGYERILRIAKGLIGKHPKNSQPVGEFLRFLAARMCDKIQLAEIGHRSATKKLLLFFPT